MFLFTPFLLFLLAGLASAGNRFWESSLLETVEKNATSNIEKRAMWIKDKEGEGNSKAWTNKRLRYCYYQEPTAAERGMVLSGIERWAVLKDHGFNFVEVLDEAVCERDRGSILLIKFNDQGKLSTTVGMQAPKDDFEGPTMHLSVDESIGMREIAGNAAHEFGHALGLFHEHQNSKFWKSTVTDEYWTIYSGKTFHASNFNCKALKDYEEKMAEAEASSDPTDAKTLCTRFQTAKKFDFSGQEWLPMEGVTHDADKEVDLKSIMLYPSGAGGRGDAGADFDYREHVLTLGDDVIPENRAPSTQDIAALLRMYGSAKAETPQLYVASGSKMRNKIRRVASKFSLHGGDTAGGSCSTD